MDVVKILSNFCQSFYYDQEPTLEVLALLANTIIS
jgi:hypothetical protein